MMETISMSQAVVMSLPIAIILILLSYKAGEFNSKQYYINHGAEQHWLGKIECGRVGEEVFCARSGDEQ